MASNAIEIEWQGTLRYGEGLALQERAVSDRIAGTTSNSHFISTFRGSLDDHRRIYESVTTFDYVCSTLRLLRFRVLYRAVPERLSGRKDHGTGTRLGQTECTIIAGTTTV